MGAIEKKAIEIDTILSPKSLHLAIAERLRNIECHLKHARVIKHSQGLHRLVVRIILNAKKTKDNSHKKFTAVSFSSLQGPWLREALNTKYCHGNLSFRLAHLERLLLEDRINLRTFKQLKAILVKTQFASLQDLSFAFQRGSKLIKVRSLKPLKLDLEDTFDDHICANGK